MMRFYTNYDLLLEPSILVQFKKVLMQSTCSIHPFRNPTGHWCQIRGFSKIYRITHLNIRSESIHHFAGSCNSKEIDPIPYYLKMILLPISLKRKSFALVGLMNNGRTSC
ncbi:hypothetical protein RclHR1_01310007 [Rhizophagus clarus]|uniref:Uncharacterized protein n=1 Tax=Rhizophagus clarus TaxID=94130 RepID=A0A2Z6QPR3_9GLOM|nr:hypothetical protein RclHR1_01310007 [Rhizophagus clarus]